MISNIFDSVIILVFMLFIAILRNQSFSQRLSNSFVLVLEALSAPLYPKYPPAGLFFHLLLMTDTTLPLQSNHTDLQRSHI